jgi:hypothetical protein
VGGSPHTLGDETRYVGSRAGCDVHADYQAGHPLTVSGELYATADQFVVVIGLLFAGVGFPEWLGMRVAPGTTGNATLYILFFVYRFTRVGDAGRAVVLSSSARHSLLLPSLWRLNRTLSGEIKTS